MVSRGCFTVAVLVLFGVILLACAAEVVRLARDARADADSEQDVFDRRKESRKATWHRLRHLAQEFRRTRTTARTTAPVPPAAAPAPAAAPSEAQRELATVRIAPVAHPRPERDLPTIPAMSR
jgi:hypothetical protein